MTFIKRYTSLFLLVAFLAVVFCLWGYVYEFAYFLHFNLDVHDTLGPTHFIYTGFSNIAILLVIIIVFSLVTKFFSKDIVRDDLKQVRKSLKKMKFSEQIILARVAFILSFIFMLLAILNVSHWFGRDIGFGGVFLLIIFFNMQLFLRPLWLSPPQSLFTVAAVFVLSVAMCFVAGGLHHARYLSGYKIIIRDDAVVQIRREGERVVAEAKVINIPNPFIKNAMDWATKP